jgi:hypothetical protein
MGKTRLLQFAVAMLVGLGMLAATVPAQAATWYTFSRYCGTFFTQICDVQYTGGYPSGVVRASGSLRQYEVQLQTQTAIGGPWSTVAKTFPQTSKTIHTPSVHAGRSNSYRGCVRTVQGGALLCLSPQGTIYLGD